MDAPRQDKVDFLLRHQLGFRLALNYSCPKASFPFSHDPNFVPVGQTPRGEETASRDNQRSLNCSLGPKTAVRVVRRDRGDVRGCDGRGLCEPVENTEFDA